MKIAIYDKGGGEFEENARDGAIAVFGPLCVELLDVSPREAVQHLRQFTHIVCHVSSDTSQSASPSWSNLIGGDHSTVQVILRVSSQGAGGMSDSFRPPYRHKKGVWVLHLIEPAGSVTIQQWRKIFLAIKEWDTTQPVLAEDVRAIFEKSSDRQALRLLCQAWLFAQGAASKPLGNITVHAPTQSKDWFNPFAEACTTDAAEHIARRMGDVEGEAMDLLNRIAKEESGRVTWESYRDHVARLEAALG